MNIYSRNFWLSGKKLKSILEIQNIKSDESLTAERKGTLKKIDYYIIEVKTNIIEEFD